MSKNIFRSLSKYLVLLILLFVSCGESTNNSSDNNLPFFINVLNQVGIFNVGGFGQTSAWGDYNNDGLLDIFIANTDFFAPTIFLFRNNGNGTFTDVSVQSGIADIPLRSAAWADYNNDGLLDLVVGTIMSGAPPILYENVDGETFVDVSFEAGLNVSASVTWHTLWSDYDRDGDVDLLQVNDGSSILYQNQGDGMFLDFTAMSGLGESFSSNSAIWFDYNNDGFPDLFFANDGLNTLYRNNGNGSFSDVSIQAGVSGDVNWQSISACVADYNNDGFYDLYVGNIESSRNALYMNNRDGTFSDVTLFSGTEDVGDGRTCAWIDFDSDGLVDLLSTNHLNPTMLFKNLGNGRFDDVAVQTGIELPIDAFSASWGDFNLDGFMDVFLHGHLGSALYQNSGNDNNNVVIELRGNGITTNTSAIGVRVDLITSVGTQSRVVSGGKGCCEQNMLPVHFGVRRDSDVDIFVEWTNGDSCFFGDILVEGGVQLLISQDFCNMIEL